jgi:hypothetical protein
VWRRLRWRRCRAGCGTTRRPGAAGRARHSPGGIITCVGLPYFDGIAEIREKRVVVRGIALELLAAAGVCAPDADALDTHNPVLPSTFAFKLLLDQRLRAEQPRLRVLFNTQGCDVATSGDRISAVTLANKDGLTTVRPQVVIDCSGDGDIAAWAGAPCEQADSVQPLTLHFRIGRVRPTPTTSADCRAALAAAQARGDLPSYYGPGVIFMYAQDEVYIHGVRVPADPTDAADLTRAEMQGRADAFAMYEAWRREVPGFEDAYFIEAYPWIGVRESRRILGQYVLTEDDLMRACRFDDAVATGCWYLDLHPNTTTVGSANDFVPEKAQPAPYDIPYRSLLPQHLANLIVAGRCHAATRGAHASTRVTATAMAMGEAAGIAAALAVNRRMSPQAVDPHQLISALATAGGGAFTDNG